MQINISECRIARYTDTKIGVNMTLEIKEEDLSLGQRELLRHMYKDGTCLKTSVTSIEEEIKEDKKEEPKEIKPISDEKYLRKLCIQFAGEEYYEEFKKERGVKHLNELTQVQIQEEINNFENILQINDQ